MKLLLSALGIAAVMMVQGCNTNTEKSLAQATGGDVNGVSAERGSDNKRFYRNYTVSADNYCDRLLAARAPNTKALGLNLIHEVLGLDVNHVALTLDNANSRLSDTVGVPLAFFIEFMNNNHSLEDDATLQALFNLDTATIDLLDRDKTPIDNKLYNALKKHGYRLFLNNEEITKAPVGPKFVTMSDGDFSVLPPDNVKLAVGVTFPDTKSPDKLKRDITLNFVIAPNAPLTLDNMVSVTMKSVYQRAEGVDINDVMSHQGYGGCKVSLDASGKTVDMKPYIFKDNFTMTTKTVSVKGNKAMVYGLSSADKVVDL